MVTNQVTRALLSVYDKTNLLPFAKELENKGVEIVSTGGTLRHLREQGLSPVAVEEVTDFPEILQGRVKTLHPKIHAGILAKTGNEAELDQLDIQGFDLVVVNLYPFSQVVQNQQADLDEIMENIDIGGPAMLRAAAKNWKRVGVCVSPQDYKTIINQLDSRGGLGEDLRKQLAAKAFCHTAEYDKAIDKFFRELTSDSDTVSDNQIEVPGIISKFKETEKLNLHPLNYGENPHQKAGFIPYDHVEIQRHQGKDLSYNNINDLDAAVSLVREFDEPAVATVKHTNPCGLGIAESVSAAYQKAYQGDPISIFGGIVASNQTVTAEMAEKVTEIFIDVVAAPDYSEEALKVLATKPGMKVISVNFDQIKTIGSDNFQELASTSLGYLYQEPDDLHPEYSRWEKVSGEELSSEQLNDVIVGEKIVKYVKSNAIVLVKQNQLIGVGAGQMNRVAAARIALEHAGESAQDCVLASDAFFPFDDVVHLASQYGVSGIVQPGGSKRDQDSIEAAHNTGITMYFTGTRHFKH